METCSPVTQHMRNTWTHSQVTGLKYCHISTWTHTVALKKQSTQSNECKTSALLKR